MAVPFAQGIWQVKPGRGDDFIAAWTEFAEWTAANTAGACLRTAARGKYDSAEFATGGEVR